MKSGDYLKLVKKENKSEVEWELLKAVSTLRLISESVTHADKHEKDAREHIADIRQHLKENGY